ncbi:MAG: hypothetical protein V1834_04685 [Candidatus Micrarchaeota archaeon]
MMTEKAALEARVAALEQALQTQAPRLAAVERKWVKDAPIPGRERRDMSAKHPVNEPTIVFQFLSILEDWGLIKLYHTRVPFERAMFEVGFVVPDAVVYMIVIFSLIYSAIVMGVV